MLTSAQRERILCHLRRGWKLPDSLVQELWTAYETLEQTLSDQGSDSSQPINRTISARHHTQQQHSPRVYETEY